MLVGRFKGREGLLERNEIEWEEEKGPTGEVDLVSSINTKICRLERSYPS